MRRSLLAVAGLLLMLALPGLIWGSSIGGGGLANQMGARLANAQTAPAVRAGVTYSAVIVDANKAIQMGLAGARVGDRITIAVLENSKLTVTLVPATTTAGRSDGGGALTRSDGGGARTATVLNFKYDSAGKMTPILR